MRLCLKILALVLSIANLFSSFGYAKSSLGEIPVLMNGRVKPLDTVARVSMLVLAGKQKVRLEDGETYEAEDMLPELLFDFDQFRSRKILRIDHPEVLSLFGITQDGQKYFSLDELFPKLNLLMEQENIIRQKDVKELTPYEKQLMKVSSQIGLIRQLSYSFQVPGSSDVLIELNQFRTIAASMPLHNHFNHFQQAKQLPAIQMQQLQNYLNRYQMSHQLAGMYAVPMQGDTTDSEWESFGRAALRIIDTRELPSALKLIAEIGDAYRSEDSAFYEECIHNYSSYLKVHHPEYNDKARHEKLFNQLDPFDNGMVLYLIGLLALFVSWIGGKKYCYPAALFLILFAFVLHTTGLVFRIALEGRPPVTNLYSSAVFIGWAAVCLSFFIEKNQRSGIGLACSGIIGFSTLLIAYHLSLGGDTMEMMQAVLDHNFWLATHVVVISIGYSTTFLAGFIAIFYLIGSRFSSRVDKKSQKSMISMAYGMVCFAMLFSFVGTILGGIWADQSWGRFWGWDPKENGALMIVLWNALVLHARWSGVATSCGFMALVVIGNVITAWSWFGTNLLGVGLHSYGFTESGFYFLSVFVISQLLVITLLFKNKKCS